METCKCDGLFFRHSEAHPSRGTEKSLTDARTADRGEGSSLHTEIVMNTSCLLLSVVLFAPAQGDPTKAPPATENAEPAPGNEARNRQTSSNNLKQLALAVHSYHDVHGKMPADVMGKDGKPILSWRVLLLPYMEEDRLYKEFKLDEPWDSKHNLPLLERMPRVLQSPRVTLKAKGYTVYQGFSGPLAVFRPGQPLRMAGVTDGTSNTILA